MTPCKSIVCLENARFVCFCKANRLRDLCKARTKRRYFPKTVRLSIWCASAGKICWHCTGNTSGRSILRRQERAKYACIWRCPRPHYAQMHLFAVHAVCNHTKAHSCAVFCLLALFMILVSTRSTARRTRRRVMSAAVAQIETSVFMRARSIFVERDICFIRSEDCAFCGDMPRNSKSDRMRKHTVPFL